jgi:antitoxin StbD
MTFKTAMEPILASTSVGISELKANPSAVLESSADMPVAILNRNKPVGYLMSAKAWEAICDQLEDVELRRIAEARLNDGQQAVRVTIDEL